jgi:hypothetical protein
VLQRRQRPHTLTRAGSGGAPHRWKTIARPAAYLRKLAGGVQLATVAHPLRPRHGGAAAGDFDGCPPPPLLHRPHKGGCTSRRSARVAAHRWDVRVDGCVCVVTVGFRFVRPSAPPASLNSLCSARRHALPLSSPRVAPGGWRHGRRDAGCRTIPATPALHQYRSLTLRVDCPARPLELEPLDADSKGAAMGGAGDTVTAINR